MRDPKRDLAETNRRAWDDLYGSTPDSVWGTEALQFVQDFLHALRGRVTTALDAGTGEGRNLPALLELGAQVSACDASLHALGKIPARVAQAVDLRHCDLSALPYEDAAFDLVMSIDVIETLPNVSDVLAEFRRVLRPDGLLLCNIPGEEDSVAGVEMESLGEHRYLFRDSFFYQFLDEGAAVGLLLGAGFRVREMKLCTWLEDPHPNFRGEQHSHTSRVFLAERIA